jgi:hypothetical protein
MNGTAFHQSVIVGNVVATHYIPFAEMNLSDREVQSSGRNKSEERDCLLRTEGEGTGTE